MRQLFLVIALAVVGCGTPCPPAICGAGPGDADCLYGYDFVVNAQGCTECRCKQKQ